MPTNITNNGGHEVNFEPYEVSHSTNAQQKYTKEELKLAKAYIEEELEKRFKKVSKNEDITKLMIEVAAIFALNAALGRVSGKKSLWDIIPEILRQTQLNAATYKSNTVWYLQIAGGGISTVAGLAGAGGMAYAANQANLIYVGQQAFNSLGSLIGTTGNLKSQYLTGDRTIGENKVAILTIIKDRANEISSSESRKSQESLEKSAQAIQSVHSAFMQIGGN